MVVFHNSSRHSGRFSVWAQIFQEEQRERKKILLNLETLSPADSPEYNSPSLSIAFHSPYYEQDSDAPNKNNNHQNKAIFSGQVSKEFLATCHVFCKKINVNVTLMQLQGMRSVN